MDMSATIVMGDQYEERTWEVLREVGQVA